MLIQFNFKNYRSFRDDTILDLTADKITEHESHVIHIGREKLLSIAAIFGANASGKSNVLDALSYMHMYVIQSFAYGGNSDDKKEQSDFIPTPFLFDANSADAESTFEVYYITPEKDGAKTYNYGFSVDKKGIVEEWLNFRSKTSKGDFRRIFYRNNKTNERDYSGLSKKVRENIETSLEPETLIVSLGSKLKIDKLKAVRDWFYRNECTDFGDPTANFILSRVPPHDILNPRVQKNIVKFFSTFDSSIIDLKVEKIPSTDDKDGSSLKISTIHNMVNSSETSTLSMRDESAGTLKMFTLYPMLHDVIENGGVLFVDELNGRLHPLLVRNILQIFVDPKINIKHAQIIFTTHDPWSLNNGILRRDEIWFTEKDVNGVSSLYSLVDFILENDKKIRQDENYEKNYLLGKYGAIPYLKSFYAMEDKD